MQYIDLPISGGVFQYNRISVSSNYNVTSSDNYIGCDASLGALTLQLPKASSLYSGRCIVIKDEGGSSSNALTRVFVTPQGTDKIDGSNLTLSLLADHESITLVCNGVDEWFII
jgi:hypothetical protein